MYVSTQEGVINVENWVISLRGSMMIGPFKCSSCTTVYTERCRFESHRRPVPRGVAFFVRFFFLLRLGDYVDGKCHIWARYSPETHCFTDVESCETSLCGSLAIVPYKCSRKTPVSREGGGPNPPQAYIVSPGSVLMACFSFLLSEKEVSFS
jgi:hypothetical protein